MRKTMKYETPEIEFTRFVLEQNIMQGDDGDVNPESYGDAGGDNGDLPDDLFDL